MDTTIYQEKLLAEEKKLKDELGQIATPDAGNPGNWTAMSDPTDEVMSRDEAADKLEDLAERQGAEQSLERQLLKVTAALKKIEEGTYGTCEIGGEMIEADRLNANPSARTCKAHLDEEDAL